MRDAHPLVGDLLVHLAGAAVVELVEIVVHLAQAVLGERLVRLGHPVRLVLELGEHRLAEDRRAEVLQQVAHQHDLRLAVALVLLHQVLGEQDLVAGRGDLGDEDRVLRLGLRLGPVGVEAVHRVAHLVAERGQAVVGLLVVEQHIGRRVVHAAAAVCAAALVLRLIDVDPALRQRAGGILHIVLAQRRNRLQERVKRLADVHPDVKARVDVHIHVVHVHDGQAQLLLLDAQVLGQRADAAVHRLDQAVIDVLADLVRIQRRLARALIAAGLRHEHVRLHLASVERGDCVAQLAVAVHGVHIRRLAHGAVVAVQEGKQARVGELGLFAVLAARHAQVHVRVGQQVIGVLRRAADVAGHRQQLLLARGERVRLHAQRAAQHRVVLGKVRIVDERLERAVRQREQLRHQERAVRAQLAGQAGRLREHALILAHGGVLVLLHHRIAVDAGHRRLQLRIPADGGQNRFAAAGKRARQRGKRLSVLAQRGIRLLPRLIRCINAGHVPRIAGIDRRTGQFLFHDQNTSFMSINRAPQDARG